MPPRHENQHDIQHENLVQEISPDLPGQHDHEHHDRTAVERQQVDITHQRPAPLPEIEADILGDIVAITLTQTPQHPLQHRRSLHLQHRVPAVQEIKELYKKDNVLLSDFGEIIKKELGEDYFLLNEHYDFISLYDKNINEIAYARHNHDYIDMRSNLLNLFSIETIKELEQSLILISKYFKDDESIKTNTPAYK